MRAGRAGVCADPGLETLHLDLFNRVADDRLEAIAMPKDTPALRELHLDLSMNQIGDDGAHALAVLAEEVGNNWNVPECTAWSGSQSVCVTDLG